VTTHPYASALYASAFAPYRAVPLPHAGSHVLARPIPGGDRLDLMGCYPLFVLDATEGLAEDFAALGRQGLVSFVGVTDCLTAPDDAFLSRHFDLARPFKVHNVYDASQPGGDYSKHHRERVRKAHRKCETRIIDLAEHLDAWCACYDTLIARKGITGIQAFSRGYFETVARVPGTVTVGAFAEGQLVSAHIWFKHGACVYAHLAASTELGYKLLAAFAIYDFAIQMFRADHIIDLGGGAGTEASETDGLSLFKQGFANARRTNRLVGKILDAEAYAALSPSGASAFFPAYRRPVAPD
jgi:hypothetical protein